MENVIVKRGLVDAVNKQLHFFTCEQYKELNLLIVPTENILRRGTAKMEHS